MILIVFFGLIILHIVASLDFHKIMIIYIILRSRKVGKNNVIIQKKIPILQWLTDVNNQHPQKHVWTYVRTLSLDISRTIHYSTKALTEYQFFINFVFWSFTVPYILVELEKSVRKFKNLLLLSLSYNIVVLQCIITSINFRKILHNISFILYPCVRMYVYINW